MINLNEIKNHLIENSANSLEAYDKAIFSEATLEEIEEFENESSDFFTTEFNGGKIFVELNHTEDNLYVVLEKGQKYEA